MAAPQQIGVTSASGGLGLGAAGGLLSLGSGLLNGLFNYASMGKQAEISKDLMKYEWDNFKSPKAQVNALAAAGINPAVALGQGGSGFSATPSPSMPSSTAPHIDGLEIANFVQAMALAKKAGLESVGQNIENQYNESVLSDRIKAVALQNKWTSEQTAKLTQEIGLMSGQFNEIQQRIENMRSEKNLTDKNVEWFDRHMSAEIAHLRSSADYQNALKGLTDEQKNLLENTMDDLCRLTGYQADQMEKVVGLLDKYGDAQAIVGMISQVIGSASDLIGTFYKPAQVAKKLIKVE